MARSDVDHRGRTSPPGLEATIAAIAARQHGVVTGRQLAALGLGPSGVQYRATVGRLHRVHRGVYAVIRVTTVARTLVDVAAAGTPAHRLERDVHEGVVLGLFDRGALLDALGRAPERPGARALRASVSEPDPGATRSALERLFLGLCRRHGLPAPCMNAHLHAEDRLVEVDAHWPAARLVVELDGHAVHDTPRAFHGDRAGTRPSSPRLRRRAADVAPRDARGRRGRRAAAADPHAARWRDLTSTIDAGSRHPRRQTAGAPPGTTFTIVPAVPEMLLFVT